MSSKTSTPFPLGAYLGNPDNSNAAAEATFTNYFTSFTALMGSAPQFLDVFIDQSQPVSQWVGNSQWDASSFAASSNARTTTPVIALPLSSNAPGSMSADQSFKAFAAGQYDSTITSIVQVWASQGFKNLVFRPGWEMNIPSPTYAGDDAQSQKDWVSAFQHVYTVLHQAAAANGVTVNVVWNPSVTNYSNAEATTNLYPGNNFVDTIGADVYSNIYPYSDGGATPTYHDWDTGGQDTTTAQFIADPVNRHHYWSLPAATKWSSDGSGGHSQSLDSLIKFAEAQGKPFAVPETGAGNSSAGTDVTDDAAFPQWLSQELTTARAAGETISFVNLWDSNGGGNYEFTSASDGKPAEAAAWATDFGASAPAAAAPVAPATGSPVAPSGFDALVLSVAEDAWQGDAQFTVSINGATIGGTRTATASHAAGATQSVSISGTWGASPTVGVTFINDAYGGTPSTDRNLYVTAATYDGHALAGAPATLLSNGTATLTLPPASTTLTLHLAEDAWNGDAQYSVAVDGQTLVQNSTVTASHATGQSQAVNLQDVLSSGTHDIALSFLNDAYGGSSTTDRNLYLSGLDVNGTAASGTSASLYSNGTQHFQFVVPAVS